MLCPKCESEYVDGIALCPTCQIPLVDGLENRPARPAISPEPCVALRTTSAEAVAVAKSILIDAGIPFGVRGEEVQDLFGYGRFPTGNSVLMGPIEIVIPQSAEGVARELLASLQDDARKASAAEDGESEPALSLWTLARPVSRIAAWLILGALVLELAFVLVANLVSGG